MLKQRIADIVVLLVIFLLPWQTRWIYLDLTIGGEAWEYGRLSLYAVEMLIALAVVLRGRPRIPPSLSSFVNSAALLLGVLLISASFSQNVSLALATLPHFAAAVALFLLVADGRTDLRQTAWAFAAGLVVPCGLAWYQVTAGTSPSFSWLGLASHDALVPGQSVVETASGRVLRGYGTLPHPNVFGGYLVVGLIMTAWAARGIKKPGTRLMAAAPAALFASALVITFSRSAWLGASVGFGTFAVVALWTRRARPHQAIPFASFALIAVLVTMAVFHSAVFTRFSPASRLEAKSIEERVGSYAEFDDVLSANVVMGVGPGNYTAALATVFPGREAWSYQPVHNALLLGVAEAGLILLFPLAKFAIVLYRLLREKRSTVGGLFAAAILVSLLPVALLDHYLWSLWPGLALAAVSLGFSLKMNLDT